jgi:hypothetical protein
MPNFYESEFGQYWNDPYNEVSGQVQPNPASSYSLYTWTPADPKYVNGLPVYEPGQEGRLLSVTGARADGKAATTLDPSLSNQFSRQATAYVEREVAPNFGVRTGFVWNAWRGGYGKMNDSTPFASFNVPVTVTIVVQWRGGQAVVFEKTLTMADHSFGTFEF